MLIDLILSMIKKNIEWLDYLNTIDRSYHFYKTSYPHIWNEFIIIMYIAICYAVLLQTTTVFFLNTDTVFIFKKS